MSKPNQGPRLRLYGPDTRHGARARKGFRDYKWYVVWYERGRQCERATGLGHRAGPEETAEALAAFIRAQQPQPERPAGPRRPDEMTIAEALVLYGHIHAPETEAPWRIAMAIEALVGVWGEAKISAITGATCRRYTALRKTAIADKMKARRAATIKRYALAGKEPPATKRETHGSDGTARKELGVLSAALNWCAQEGYLVQPPPVWRPDKPEARVRWLTRSEAARLLLAARQMPRSKYLTLFIRLALYTASRKEAILGLQWSRFGKDGYVDLERGQIDFRKQGEAESNKRRSAMPIPPRLRAALQAARRQNQQYVIEYRKPTADEIERGIVGVKVGDVKKAFEAAAIAAGMPDVTPHVLKHTAITWLVQKGVPLWDVAQWSRTSVEMIDRVYGHHAPDRFARVIEAQRGGKS